MLLVIDAGNTNITVGVYKEDRLLFVSRLATSREATSDRFAIDFHALFRLHEIEDSELEGAVISSVVPEITNALRQAARQIIGKDAVIVGPGTKCGLNIKIDDPATLGADLVTTAVAAKELYPLPCLILDLGTATKVTALNAKGEFLGGSITPGVTLSMRALANGASQLPAISLEPPKHAIGTNTVDSMRSGIVFSTADLLDGMCVRFEKELDKPVKTIVATGGLSDIALLCSHDIVLNKDLMLQGLKIIYEKNQ